jgi:hypothetical protein
MTARVARSRRDVLAAAIAVPAVALAPDLPTPAFAADSRIVAAGARFERLLLEFFEATLDWAPRLAGASRKAATRLGLSRHEIGIGARRDFSSAMFEEFARNGGAAASRRMSALERRLMPLARTIIASRETSLAALRAKMLVVLYEARPTCADALDTWAFPDDAGATRSLLAAVAELTGLRMLLHEVEARFTATAEAIAAEDAALAV